MDNVRIKYLVVEVDGEATISFPIPELDGTDRHEMIQAIIDSNPTLRLVDHVAHGGIWNGLEYAKS